MPMINVPTVRGPAPPTPPRHPWSVRRTSTIDTCWPNGMGTDLQMVGRARDLLTTSDADAPVVVAEDSFTARLTPGRQIIEIDALPPREGLAKLAGAQAGRQLRTAIADSMPSEMERGTPLYLLLDDIAGASLVCLGVWSLWLPDLAVSVSKGPGAEAQREKMRGVCIGFSSDSPVMLGGPEDRIEHPQIVAPLDDVADPLAWHSLPAQDGPAARRARRIDVRIEDDKIVVGAHFQDSATRPDGQRMAVHEYLLHARVDCQTMLIEEIAADPRVLPFDYCPAAVLNIGRLVGTAVSSLRTTVVRNLAREQGCTHLNDMLRSLAEAPHMLAPLMAARAEGK